MSRRTLPTLVTRFTDEEINRIVEQILQDVKAERIKKLKGKRPA